MNPTDIWMQDQHITKSPPIDKNRKGNSGHSSMPHLGFESTMSTEWLNKACLSTVYLIMGSRSHTTYTGLGRPRGFQDIEAPRFHDSRYVKVVRLSALRTGRLYPQGNIPGTHFCQRLSQPQGHSVAGRIMSMKNSSDTMRNPTRNLTARSLRHNIIFITCLRNEGKKLIFH